jgi:hypothetical protein
VETNRRHTRNREVHRAADAVFGLCAARPRSRALLSRRFLTGVNGVGEEPIYAPSPHRQVALPAECSEPRFCFGGVDFDAWEAIMDLDMVLNRAIEERSPSEQMLDIGRVLEQLNHATESVTHAAVVPLAIPPTPDRVAVAPSAINAPPRPLAID